MQEPMIKIDPDNSHNAHYKNGVTYSITLSEAERIGEEVKRIKAEMAKREEIGPGDIFIFCKSIRKAVSIDGDTIMDTYGNPAYNPHCKKLHPTPEVRAWLDSVLGG
jgi:hypothetical protein